MTTTAGARLRKLRILGPMLAAMILVLGFVVPAAADHISTVPSTSDANQPSNWETFGHTGAFGFDGHGEDDWECSKTDNDNDVSGPYVLGDPDAGYVWRLIVVKAGSDHNDLYWNPTSGNSYAATGQGAGGWSHVILCQRPEDEPDDPEEFEIELVKLWFDEEDNPVEAPETDVVTLDAGEAGSINEGGTIELEEDAPYAVTEEEGDWTEIDCPEGSLDQLEVVGEGTGEYTATESGVHVVCNLVTEEENGGGGGNGGNGGNGTTVATTVIEDDPEPEVEVLAQVIDEDEDEVRPTRVDAGAGGLLPTTGAASLIALLLAGTGLMLGGLRLRRSHI